MATSSMTRPPARRGALGSARIRPSWVVREILSRTFSPRHAMGWLRRRRDHRRTPTVLANGQLDLYGQMLPGGFLHYGYFDDPHVAPEGVSFQALQQAQVRYAERMLDLITETGSPVLDVGCGMGGLLGMLAQRGYEAVGLTPDRYQIEHVRRTYPDVPLLHCRFEDMPVGDFEGHFGTVIHSESLQYMKPKQVFRVMKGILAPGGRWIVSDYFRRGRRGERSGWRWDLFEARLADHRYRVVHAEDITLNVLPTLGFAHLLARRIGLPAYDFACDKLRTRTPGVHYVLENVAARGREAVLRNLSVIDPDRFARTKRYMLMAMIAASAPEPA